MASTVMQARRRPCFHSKTCSCVQSFLSEDVIRLVFKSTNWNPFLIATAACVCRWFKDFAKRVLWKEFCLSRGPKMVPDIASGEHRGTVAGGWDALGRLMIFCAGCSASKFVSPKAIPGHFVRTTRFSKTSGRSFLVPNCRTDTLYISDPCEHLGKTGEDDIGLFRGIFRSFSTSMTRKALIKIEPELDRKCPYCLAKVWNMLRAEMVPSSALRRLGAHGEVEYFVCLLGHLYGWCSLLHLSDSDVSSEDGLS